jgi:hypothetical protein
MKSFLFKCTVLVLVTAVWAHAAETSAAAKTSESETLLENPFQLGLILQDTNGDQIADAVCGSIVVPVHATEEENSAAANLAARIGYETSALTLPLVVTSAPQVARAGCKSQSMIWIGAALPEAERTRLLRWTRQLGPGEGGIYAVKDGLTLQAHDAVGMLAAGDALAARAPFAWSVPGAKLNTLAKTLTEALQKANLKVSAQLAGITYLAHSAGVHEALITLDGTVETAAVVKALKPEDTSQALHQFAVHEAQVMVNDAAISVAGTAAVASTGLPAAPGDEESGRNLDLGRLYTIKGLLTGNPKMLIPSGVASKLYVPAGTPGVEIANLAARMGLETTGLTLPLAEPLSGVSPSQIKTLAVVSGDGEIRTRIEDVLHAPGNVDLSKLTHVSSPSADATSLASGEGELRVVDQAFEKQGSLLIRGDEAGIVAATQYAAQRLPYLWEPEKKYASIEEIRDDLRHFFSLRSSIGQASASLYLLNRWLNELKQVEAGKKLDTITAEIAVDEADPALKSYVEKLIASRVTAAHINVQTGSLHAGLKCCEADPQQHRDSQVVPFHQATPTIAEDITIPWEGTRLLDVVRGSAHHLAPDQEISLEARVSESPEERKALENKVRNILVQAGASEKRVHVQVFSAYKQGYSWLTESIIPQLKGKAVDHIEIEFAPYSDPQKLSSLGSPSRWVQQIYPVDEVMAKQLALPLAKITFKKMPAADGPTYRVRAYAADGHELLRDEFTVRLAQHPYSNQFEHYDHVNVETGSVRLTAAGRVLFDQRIETDPEIFWKSYQTKILPSIYNYILAQNDGKPKTEYQPLFDTLRVSFHLSEPDYKIGIDEERISALEALQEDTLFSTENFFYMLGNAESNGLMDYMGRVIPVAYPSEEGRDGHVRVEFYAKDAAHPKVRLAWKETADTPEQEYKRDLPMVHTEDPRLVAARLRAGADGIESLTWSLHVDARSDSFEQWRKLVPEEQLAHTALFAEQCSAELHEAEQLHAAGLYRNELAYPHLQQLAFEFNLPLAFHPHEYTKPEAVTATFAVNASSVARPQITDFAPVPLKSDGRFVQWEHPIGPSESEQLLARLSTYPGVDVYWMGRTYLGKNIWAADILLPTPSALRSMAKETTLKAAIVYSGRQHANEVSSTSHLFRLAEQLVTDQATRVSLNRTNVVLHPITNVDGAELSMELAKITPDNMLHPGYHASLTADLVTAQWEKDPLYPESRTRAQLWNAWLPDAFLNPHGYPSHEWVEPFSEYAGWVITRTQAESGRAWWIPRGWFTSLNYLKDADHPQSETVALALRDYIVNSMNKLPDILAMNERMNKRYFRYGQQWDERDFQQPIYKGVRIYMAQAGIQPEPSAPSFLARYPDITYDDGYTEAPDETAYGDWLKLVASAGLAYDHAHLQYLTDAKMKIRHTQKEFFESVNWKEERERPMLPADIDQLDHQK